MSNMRQMIEERLQALEPEFFDFEDESHLHAGHASNKGGGQLCDIGGSATHLKISAASAATYN